MAFCGKCGAQLESHNGVCASCGQAAGAQPKSAPVTAKTGPFLEKAGSNLKGFLAVNGARKISPVFFALILLCIFLPFVTVSCGGYEVVTLSTLKLATGVTDVGHGQHIGGNFIAIILIITIIAGLVLSLWKGEKGPLATAAAAGLGLILLIALRIGVNSDLAQQSGELQGVLKGKFRAGYSLPFLLFLGAIAANVYTLLRGKAADGPGGGAG